MVLQWVDNKVVSCTSTLRISDEVPVTRRKGSEVLHLTVQKALKAYQEGMGGIDQGDQWSIPKNTKT
jgi:hypothetical protein